VLAEKQVNPMKITIPKTVNAVILVVIAGVFVVGCSYPYPGIKGRVLDAETEKPVEGAVVKAQWTEAKGAIGLTYTVVYKTEETFTDEEGRFAVAGVKKLFVDPPRLSIYKKGYVCWNNEYIFPGWEHRTDFKWKSGNVYKLERFKSNYSYLKHSSFISAVSGTPSQLFDQAYRWELLKGLRERRGRRTNNE
jgi:hypothetical protein